MSLHKVCVVGDTQTGKTAFTNKLVHNLFSEHYKSTIGVDFKLKVIDEYLGQPQGEKMRIQLWDIAGQERSGKMTRIFYKEMTGAFVLAEHNNLSTLEGAKKWKKDLDAKNDWDELYPDGTNPCILLVTKCDLTDLIEADKVKYDKFCIDNGFHSWISISSKTGENIKEACTAMVKILKTCKIQQKIEKDAKLETPKTDKTSDFEEKENKERSREEILADFHKVMNKSLVAFYELLIDQRLDNKQRIEAIKFALMKVYFSEKKDEDNIKSNDNDELIKNFSEIIVQIHQIVVNEDITDENKCTKIKNCILDYGLNSHNK